MPYVASSGAATDLLGGGPPRVLDVSWVRDGDGVAGSVRSVVTVLPIRCAGEVVYDSSSDLGERHSGPLPAGRAAQPDERSRSVAVTETLLRASERVMARVEALEVAKARLEADLVAAYGALHTIQEQQVAALPAGSSRRAAALVASERVVAEEIALATGVGAGEVGRRLRLETSPRRHRRLLAALRDGGTSLYRAVQVACDTAQLSDADVAVVEEAVLAPSRDGCRVGQRTFT
ncbi:MAG: hypothetical protein ACKOVB_06315, partial [Terrabacter sp.]